MYSCAQTGFNVAVSFPTGDAIYMQFWQFFSASISIYPATQVTAKTKTLPPPLLFLPFAQTSYGNYAGLCGFPDGCWANDLVPRPQTYEYSKQLALLARLQSLSSMLYVLCVVQAVHSA